MFSASFGFFVNILRVLAGVVFAAALFFGAHPSHAFFGKGKKEEVSVPAWYLKPASNSVRFLYGVGQGGSLEAAKLEALNDAASRLSISVSSIAQNEMSQEGSNYSEEFSKSVSAAVEKTSFNNFEISRSQQIGNVLYVEVSIDAIKFLQEKLERISYLDDRMREINERLKGKSLLEQRNDMSAMLDMALEVEKLVFLVKSLDPANSYKSYLDTIASYRKAYDAILMNMVFFIESSNKGLADVIRGGLNDQKIKVIGVKNAAGGNMVITKISHETNVADVMGAFLSKSIVNISLEADGKIISGSRIEINGASRVSKELAFNSALTNLKKRIETDGIMAVLGIRPMAE